MYIVDRNFSGDLKKIHIVNFLDNLLQQSIYYLSLGRNILGIFGYNDIHRNASIQF